MKVTIEFDEDSEQEDIQSALNGWKWKLSMFDLDQELRAILKHGYSGNKELTITELKVFTQCREMLRETMNDNNLTFDI